MVFPASRETNMIAVKKQTGIGGMPIYLGADQRHVRSRNFDRKRVRPWRQASPENFEDGPA